MVLKLQCARLATERSQTWCIFDRIKSKNSTCSDLTKRFNYCERISRTVFFYGLGIVKKQSQSFSALGWQQNGPRLGALFDCIKSKNLTCSDLVEKFNYCQRISQTVFLRPQCCKKSVLKLYCARLATERS